jgi:hypothetical protein
LRGEAFFALYSCREPEFSLPAIPAALLFGLPYAFAGRQRVRCPACAGKVLGVKFPIRSERLFYAQAMLHLFFFNQHQIFKSIQL